MRGTLLLSTLSREQQNRLGEYHKALTISDQDDVPEADRRPPDEAPSVALPDATGEPVVRLLIIKS